MESSANRPVVVRLHADRDDGLRKRSTLQQLSRRHHNYPVIQAKLTMFFTGGKHFSKDLTPLDKDGM